ncbi:box C/D snoRNA protein 1-like [Clytia hemisphaerica]|uniref:HIT-type domain-containing protein n=1 Tax=Clytia hemisphaerica TaxID=252671 RepID=A0A7M5V939_9CNID
MSSTEKTQTLLDNVDLTGQQPIYSQKVIEKTIEVHNLDGEDVTMNSPIRESPPCSSKTIIDRRLRKCEICLEELCKYTCPGCKIKTCCLSCVEKHKKMTGCIGRRDKTAFVAKSQFNNFHLLNDYRFLEEAGRLSDNAKRDYKVRPTLKPQKKEQILTRNASKSGVNLYRMAKGMKRWKENRSYYNIKEQTLFWTMKLIFDGIKEPILTKQAETLTFKELLSKYIGEEQGLDVNKEKYLKHMIHFKNKALKVFFKQEIDPGSENLRFAEMNIEGTIKDGLQSKSILEYPVFYLVLAENVQQFREEPYLQVPASDSDEEEVIEEKTQQQQLRHNMNPFNNTIIKQEKHSDDESDDDVTRPVAKQRRLDVT